MSWDDFTNVDEDSSDAGHNMMSLLPSSLRDIWEEDGAVPIAPPAAESRRKMDLVIPQSYDSSFPRNPAAAYGAGEFIQSQMRFQGEIHPDDNLILHQYYLVEFNPNRSAWFHTQKKLKLSIGDYVLTEADRGFDIGKITDIAKKPSMRDIRTAKMIYRAAYKNEIDQLPQKAEREAHALSFCKKQAADLHLPMTITGAEFQFDGKKLTFYYTAPSYIDFRMLVRTLFRVFGTRIWMCCTSEIQA